MNVEQESNAANDRKRSMTRPLDGTKYTRLPKELARESIAMVYSRGCQLVSKYFTEAEPSLVFKHDPAWLPSQILCCG